ncbi:signal peptide peptidase SppA, 36K type [Thermovibrio ammonificans HB-1]|uniref:Signal peptide peptidase SppA, 36K type n=1 Tax=Thermovibrio ammonificans (strain DSM 15698 / JCM 12110 / HB-1) TaxID=648996 RepID=E8T216_THEA1|nr:signal peptide peptidase SppA [Thermovibrio ammonificans]ADU96911.1 signal peptide peptidase SppA, 36K type [Thermovibrio ammonificans HB-1]
MKRLKGIFLLLGVMAFVVLVMALFPKEMGSIEAAYGPKVAIVRIEGVISRSEPYLKLLDRVERNSSVKAVVLRVDSPGGVVGACQEIHDKVAEVARRKPVVVSMDSVAASGGLYVSVPATKIVANPGTITGSIGVIIQVLNVSQLAQKLGIEAVTVKSGRCKDLLNPFKKPDPECLKVVQNLIDDSYNQFVEAVAKGRHLPVEKVRSFADGRIFTGRRAKELGLVDYLGGIEKAVEVAKKLGRCPGAKVVEVKPKRGFWERIFGPAGESVLKTVGKVLSGETEQVRAMYILN